MTNFTLRYAARLATGAWFGLAVGINDGDWDAKLIALSAGLGCVMVLLEWLMPTSPCASCVDRWEDLTNRERREVRRSLAAGAAAPRAGLAGTTVRVGELAARLEPLTVGGVAARVAALAVVVAALMWAEREGAPAGWLGAAVIATAVIFASGTDRASRGSRERARRAAEATRRAYNTAA